MNVNKSFKSVSSMMTMFLMIVMLFSVNAQDIINVSTHATNFSGNSRGYFFTAPCDFVITGLRAPTDFVPGAQTIQLVKFSSAPPAYPSISNNFTTLFYASNITDTCYVDVYVPVSSGDVIGVIAVRNGGTGNSVTSYPSVSGSLTSNIGLYTVDLHRFGTQQNIINASGSDFWADGGNPIGRAEIRYEIPDFKMPLPPHSSFFTGYSRGMWFTAPSDFVITGVRAPVVTNTNTQTVHLVRFNAVPPTIPTTTTSFTTLYYGSQADTNYIHLNITVSAGDIIGVLAVRDNGIGNGSTSYAAGTSPVGSSIGNTNISLHRLGWQGNIISGPADNFWTESTLPVGRVDMIIDKPAFYKHFSGGGVANTYPFSETPSGNNKRQWIFHPSDFACAPNGYIHKIYLRTSNTVFSSVNGLLIRMGETTHQTYPDATFITGLDTVLNASSIDLLFGVSGWIPIALTKPFYYSGNSNIVVEVSHQGVSTGFNILQAIVPGRSIYGNSASPTGVNQDRLAFFGFELINTMDAELVDFVNLPIAFCEAQKPIITLLQNNSPFVLNSATIQWKVDNISQPSLNWTGNLLPGHNVNVQIGAFDFIAGNSYDIEAIVSNPNNLYDIVNNNDTIAEQNVLVFENPIVNLGSDIFIGASHNVTLDAGSGYESYLWSTGETTQTIVVDSTGVGVGVKTIWVEVENMYLCTDRDTVFVGFLDDTGLYEVGGNATAMILPNPSVGPFELHLNSFPKGDIVIEVYSLEGKRIYQQHAVVSSGNDIIMVDPKMISNGIYIIKLHGDFPTVSMKLVVKK